VGSHPFIALLWPARPPPSSDGSPRRAFGVRLRSEIEPDLAKEDAIVMPEPLHPAMVHFPVAFAALAPFAALAALVAIRAGWLPARAWIAIVALQALLAGSAWLAIETGEEQEDRVEQVVPKRFIHEHEEAGERFLALAVVAFVVSATGLLRGSGGNVGRAATTAAAAIALAAAVAVGRSGGELVYRHGAADAYVERSADVEARAMAHTPGD